MHVAPIFYSRLPLLYSSCTRYLSCGGLWGPAHAIASDPLLVAYRFADLGNSHGGTAVALSLNAPGGLAGRKAGVELYQGVHASLAGQAGVFGRLCNHLDGGWSGHSCAFNLGLYGKQALKIRYSLRRG